MAMIPDIKLWFSICSSACHQYLIVSVVLTKPHSPFSSRWRAYFTSGSSALYLFLYSGFYFWTKLDITQTVPMLMYFSYMFIVSYGFFCLTGTIGFIACYLFVRQIYSAVKVLPYNITAPPHLSTRLHKDPPIIPSILDVVPSEWSIVPLHQFVAFAMLLSADNGVRCLRRLIEGCDWSHCLCGLRYRRHIREIRNLLCRT